MGLETVGLGAAEESTEVSLTSLATSLNLCLEFRRPCFLLDLDFTSGDSSDRAGSAGEIAVETTSAMFLSFSCLVTQGAKVRFSSEIRCAIFECSSMC